MKEILIDGMRRKRDKLIKEKEENKRKEFQKWHFGFLVTESNILQKTCKAKR